MRDPEKERVSEKYAAMRKFCGGFQEDVGRLSDEVWGAGKKMWAGVSEFQSSVQAQVKENEEAVGKMGEKIKKLSRDINNYIRDFW